jgi:hypothetical protein
VVCARNEEATIDQCLTSLERLRYPRYDVVCVDDGSRDRTAEIAGRHAVELVSDGHGGLCRARNMGLAHATGDVVAYIDADAYADPDWLTYLAVALDHPDAGAAGGPNWAPVGDPLLARCIGLAPGNPVHVLVDDERADHVPGCNMAFRRQRLLEVGGFDPVFRTAGDDVDVCWRLLGRGHDVRFHPAALVWHHPRRRIRDFWRQQVGYGAAEALVARIHPDRFNLLGAPRWRGTVYGPVAKWTRRGVVDAGPTGDSGFQRLYRSPRAVGILPALWAVPALALLAVVDPSLVVVPVLAAFALVAGCVLLGVRAAVHGRLPAPRRCGLVIGLLHLVQPLARQYGRLRSRRLSFPPPDEPVQSEPAVAVGPRLLRVDGTHDRAALLGELRDRVRRHRIRAERPSSDSATRLATPGWEDVDLACNSPFLWQVRLTSYLLGDVCWLRLRRRLRSPRAVAALITGGVALGAWSLALLAEALVLGAALVWLEGKWFERRVRRALTEAAHA